MQSSSPRSATSATIGTATLERPTLRTSNHNASKLMQSWKSFDPMWLLFSFFFSLPFLFLWAAKVFDPSGNTLITWQGQFQKRDCWFSICVTDGPLSATSWESLYQSSPSHTRTRSVTFSTYGRMQRPWCRSLQHGGSAVSCDTWFGAFCSGNRYNRLMNSHDFAFAPHDHRVVFEAAKEWSSLVTLTRLKAPGTAGFKKGRGN